VAPGYKSGSCDPASCRGWTVLEEDGSLRGRIFFHLGGDSGFTAVCEGQARRARAVRRAPVRLAKVEEG